MDSRDKNSWNKQNGEKKTLDQENLIQKFASSKRDLLIYFFLRWGQLVGSSETIFQGSQSFIDLLKPPIPPKKRAPRISLSP